jgi:glycosyltransferase involved in cell wall biosynthesis
MANYNKVKLISETIDSVLNQTYNNWELIIVDDCSIDGSQQLIKSTYKDARVLLIEQSENRGANYCRNIGLKQSRGQYLMFLDADDVLANNCLEKRLKTANQYSSSNLLIFSMGVFLKKVGDDSRTWIPRTTDPLNDFLQHKLPWSILQPFWKSDFIKELGGFDTDFKRLQDVELNTRALLHKKIQLQIIGGEPDCFYRVDESRKNFSPSVFLGNWVEAVNQYTAKFERLVKSSQKKYLVGTIFETYIQLLVYLKRKELSTEDFNSLEKKLLQPNRLKRIQRSIFSFVSFYNLHLPRVPGINLTLKKLLIISK